MSSIGVRPTTSGGHLRARRRVTLWAALGVLALLATLLTPLSTASAQSPTAPPHVTDLGATPGDGQVTLSWSALSSDGGSTIIRWEYQQTTPATNLWIPIAGSNRNTTRHTVTGLRNGTAYQFQIRAINGVGSQDTGFTLSGPIAADGTITAGTVVPSTTPPAPGNLMGAPGNSEVVLTWTQVSATPANDTGTADAKRENGFSDITAYEVRQKTGDADYSPWSIIIGADQTTETHTVTGLTNGVTYQFQVRARNANGAGAASETRPVTIATAPGRPRSLTAVPGNGQVTLSWQASSNGGSPITGWQFRLQSGNDGTTLTSDFDAEAWVTIPGSDADTTSYTVVSLNNDMIYRFQVRAVNATNPGLGTPATSAVVNPGMPPGRPTLSQATASASSVTLNWTPPVYPTGHPSAGQLNTGGSPILRYEYSLKSGEGDYGEWMAIPTSGTNSASTTVVDAQSYEVRSLTAGTAYQFRVRAVNATGAGEAAAMQSPVYPGTTPLAPANLTASPAYDAASGTATITLSWRSGGDGGSPIDKWEYVTATSLPGLSAAITADSWVAICENTAEAPDPTCADTTSVMLPRSLPNGQPDPVDGSTDTPGLRQAIATGLASAVLTDDEHHFIIRAANAQGDGFQSGTDSARFTLSVPSAPPAVYIETTAPGTGPGTASVSLWWTASTLGGSTLTDYEYSQKTGDGAWGAWVPAGADDTEVDVSGLTAGTTYSFRIRARNQIGAGAHTESDEIVPGAPGSPGAGTAGTAPAFAATAQTTQVTLTH